MDNRFMSPLSTKFHAQVYEEASHWLVLHRSGRLSKEDKRCFDGWLRASPERIEAYLEISAIWEEVALLDPHPNMTAADLIARARADDTVLPLMDPGDPPSDPKERSFVVRLTRAIRPAARMPSNRALGLAATLAAVGVACAALTIWGIRTPRYSTTLGEQRSITLADGSVVHMNARSAIGVKFLPHWREVTLLRGQALFTVTQDARRPFLVQAGNTRIEVVGTRFDVNEAPEGTVITVVRGRVAVFGPQISRMRRRLQTRPVPSQGEDSGDLLRHLPGHTRPIFLGADEELTVSADRLTEVKHVDAADITAWTDRRFVFDDAPLAEVVSEFNRYSARPLLVTDPEIADFRINAVFSSPDSSLLVHFLRGQPGVRVDESSSEIRISKK
jgi:transmembrane sensor